MKKHVKILVVILFTLLASISVFAFYFSQGNTTAFADNLTSYISMEVSSLRVLDGQNITAKKYMASTTKILTAICVIENANINDIVTVTNKTVGVEGSSMYLDEGEKISVKSLLYGLMLRSGNDAAETLAYYVSGSIESFANLMNETAKKIGANNSNFVNPHGLHDKNHYTTAYDLALISCYAMQNDVFKEIVSTKKVVVPWTTREYDRIMYNKNKMLLTYDGATGIKTGYTKVAGRCLVSSAIKNGMEVVTVVLNCPDMWLKSKNLLDDAFAKYSLKKIVNAEELVGFASIKNNENEKIGLYIKNDIVLPLTKEEYDGLEVKYNHKKELELPIKKDEIVGEINIYALNNLIFSEKIYTIIGKEN